MLFLISCKNVRIGPTPEFWYVGNHGFSKKGENIKHYGKLQLRGMI